MPRLHFCNNMTEPSQNSILRISDEKTLELIELYEKEGCLWNTKLDDYKSREKRVAAAERIARTLDIKNFKAKHVMIKFKNLRNSYCQELKKIRHSKTLGLGDDIYRPKVFWFPKMDSFLKPHLQPPRVNKYLLEELNNLKPVAVKVEAPSEEPMQPEEWVQMSNPDEVMLLPEPECQQSSSEDEQPLLRRRSQNSFRDVKKRKTEHEPHSTSVDNLPTHILCEISSHLESLAQHRDDPFDSFGKYVASMLRNIPIQKAMELQPKIVSLITKAAFLNSESQISQSDE